VSDGRCLAGLGRGSELGSRAGCSAAGPAMGRPSSGFAWIYAGGSSGAASQRPRGFRLGTWSEGSQSWGREEEGAAGREEGVAPHLEPQAGSERPVRTGAGWALRCIENLCIGSPQIRPLWATRLRPAKW